MKTYDVWFVPDRERQKESKIPACPEERRGLPLEVAKQLHAELSCTPRSEFGDWKIKASSTWARDGLSWWAGSNPERYSIGPYPTREQAFLAAITEQMDEVHLCEAAHAKPTVPHMVDHILERYEESNEELGDPDGDGFTLSATAEQEKDLQERFEKMFEEWRTAHGIEPKTFMFDPCITADPVPINLRAYLLQAIPFSFEAFGPGKRAAGVTDHLRKEFEEAKADPSEWVDIAILALDGAWRSFMKDERPDDPPDAQWLASWISNQAEHMITLGLGWEDLWQRCLNNPEDARNWIALHVAAMRQWDGLHYRADKGIPVYHELFAKLTINQLRVWPDWRGNQDRAIEHDRSV